VNFIADFESYCRDLESPTSYITWSALAAVAAVMRNNLWIDFQYEKIFPNIYVILYATSGATRKGPPVKIAGSLVKEINNTKFLSGRFTIQAAMKVLSEIQRNEKGQAIKGGSCLMYSEEIAAMFAGDGKATIDILTEWYEYHKEWQNNILANEQIQTISDVCVSILAATNDILFKKVFTADAIYGGLLARIFLVAESSRRQRNSRMYKSHSTESERPKLVAHLRRLSTLHGAIVPTDEAREFYDNWYNTIDDSVRDPTGVLHRMHTSVVKLALIISAADYKFNFILEKKHFEQAIDMCSSIMKNYKLIAGGAGTSKTAVATKEFLTIMLGDSEGRGVDKKVMIRKLFGTVDPQEVDIVAENLIKAEFLEIKNSRYVLTDKFKEEYQQKLKEKKKDA
jgi:hypothetical protein